MEFFRSKHPSNGNFFLLTELNITREYSFFLLTVKLDGSDWGWMIIQCLNKNEVVYNIKDVNESVSPGWCQQFVTCDEKGSAKWKCQQQYQTQIMSIHWNKQHQYLIHLVKTPHITLQTRELQSLRPRQKTSSHILWNDNGKKMKYKMLCSICSLISFREN